MFAEDFHHPPVGRNIIVARDDRSHCSAILYRKDIPEAIGIGLVRAEEAEVLLAGICRKHIAHHLAELASRLMTLYRRPGHVKRVVSNGWHVQIGQELP